jgi:Ca2+-binding EF-hand superfamily protein
MSARREHREPQRRRRQRRQRAPSPTPSSSSSSSASSTADEVDAAALSENFTALALLRQCERCAKPQSRSRKFARCASCEQAVCPECRHTSATAMPGSILCLDCMEELGEVLDDSSSSGGDDAAPPAAVGLPGAVRTGATELAAGAGVAAAADGVASASGPLPHPTGDEGPGDLEKDAGALVWEAAGIDVEVARLFRELDSDNSGYLERGEVWELVKRLGRELSAEQLAEAMAELDPNGDGRVSVAEFAGWWKLAGKKRQGFLGRIFAETRGQMAKGLRSRIVHARAQVGSKWGALRQSVRRRSMRRVALALKRRLAGAAAALRHPLASSRALKLRWREKKEAKRRSAEEEARRAAEQDEYALSPALMALLTAEEEAQATAEEAGEEGGHTVVDEAEREDEQIMAMFAVFQQFDRDRSGFIDAKELRGVLAAQGFEMTQAEAAAMLEGMDEIEKDGLISFEEFYTCVQRQAAAHGKPLRSMADAIETLQDMRREIEEKARAGERQGEPSGLAPPN